MRNGNTVRWLVAVWLAGMMTVLLPGVALCGGTFFSDVLSSSVPFFASLAVVAHLATQRKTKTGEVKTALKAARS
ncbi:hypothetical protein [Streptomyces abikoensis]|uniref:hypothetical protein n=1 Tax=Streptomyces abikoensis TaxID=97398 RepID=UPI00369292D5